jgi:hypothetical protein
MIDVLHTQFLCGRWDRLTEWIWVRASHEVLACSHPTKAYLELDCGFPDSSCTQVLTGGPSLSYVDLLECPYSW